MHFKVTARTILQLGAELISSDAIAFYELIKNAFDAGSKKVQVRIVTRLSHNVVENYLSDFALIENKRISSSELGEIRNDIIQNINREAPESIQLEKKLLTASTLESIRLCIKEANYIVIKDEGEGMSLDDLEDIYLTIGTRSRRRQRESNIKSNRPILGEKGLGRLSVMRLGERLRVETTQTGDEHYSELEIDWSLFSHDSDALIETINIEPKIGNLKSNPEEQGTTIFIYDLRSEWTKSKLDEIAKSQLGRFVDPFEKRNRDFITLWFNKLPIVLTGVDKKLFEYAHATAKASLNFDSKGDPIFTGEIDYKTYDRQKTFSLTGTHIASVLETPRYLEVLKSLGSFKVELYWYNRKLLTRNEGVIDAPYINELVQTWGGGLMMYRDGFRVNPYGGPNDDWLNLDPIALASPGYKLNRRQIVGKVDISSNENPMLLDQTNREGLRENAEKNALVALLKYLIWKELKTFLDDIKKVEDENLAALSLNEIEKRIYTGQNQVRAAVEFLKERYPHIKKETETLSIIEDVLQESADLFKSAKASSEALENRLKTTIDLAGLGLMVDVIAHELNRSTEHAIKTINSLSLNAPQGISSMMNTLKTQLKTLQTRLKVIDPLGPSGRQQKVMTDLRKLIKDTLESHSAQFKRHQIHFELIDKYPLQEWNVKVVPGMIVQIMENLLNNSVYWLKQEQNVNKTFHPVIEVTFNRKNESILYSDNGPGIPKEKKEDIFRPFFSTKPPGDGKGLGLYISRENAKYNNAVLSLLDENKNNLNTFILSLNNN